MHAIRNFSLYLCCTIIVTLNFTPASHAGKAQDLLSQAYSAYQQEQWKSAQKPLERAIQLYPGYADAHHLLGLVLVQLNQPDQAITALQHAIKAYPSFAQAYLDLGFVLQDQKQFEQAEQAFRQATNHLPELPRELDGTLRTL